MSKVKVFYLCIILFLLFLSSFFIKIDTLILLNVNTNEIISIFKVSPEDTFSMQWIHSVELEPWTELFSVDEELSIILTATKFKAFGAGVPHIIGNKTIAEDGFITFSEINKTMPSIIYGISTTSKHTFTFNNSTLKLYQHVASDTPVKIFAEKIALYEYMLEKLKSQTNSP